MPYSDQILIRQLDAGSLSRWDQFVENHPDATFFHLSGWHRVLEQSFAHPCYFLYAERAGQICGVLPLGHINSRLFGNTLISSPFCVYGGSVATDEDVYQKLDEAACDLAQQLQVDALELRYRRSCHTDWPKKNLYATFRKEIDPDPEKNLLAIPRKQRAMVRKGIKAGLTARRDDDVGKMHRIYSESVRNLGTPVFSPRYFRTLKDVFGDRCEILTIYHQDRLVAGVMNFLFRDEILPYYGGGNEHARALKANDFMYWEAMRHACQTGKHWFDFGRSKFGTGSFDFKRNWGFTPEPLSYEYYLVRAKTMPEINPLNPKYRLFIQAWKRLPLFVSRTIGPWLAKDLG